MYNNGATTGGLRHVPNPPNGKNIGGRLAALAHGNAALSSFSASPLSIEERKRRQLMRKNNSHRKIPGTTIHRTREQGFTYTVELNIDDKKGVDDGNGTEIGTENGAGNGGNGGGGVRVRVSGAWKEPKARGLSNAIVLEICPIWTIGEQETTLAAGGIVGDIVGQQQTRKEGAKEGAMEGATKGEVQGEVFMYHVGKLLWHRYWLQTQAHAVPSRIQKADKDDLTRVVNSVVDGMVFTWDKGQLVLMGLLKVNGGSTKRIRLHCWDRPTATANKAQAQTAQTEVKEQKEQKEQKEHTEHTKQEEETPTQGKGAAVAEEHQEKEGKAGNEGKEEEEEEEEQTEGGAQEEGVVPFPASGTHKDTAVHRRRWGEMCQIVQPSCSGDVNRLWNLLLITARNEFCIQRYFEGAGDDDGNAADDDDDDDDDDDVMPPLIDIYGESRWDSSW